jgi:recombination protein RecA
MPSASALRKQIELSLERRFPAALTPQPRTFRETAPTGIHQIDALLNGGLPVGAISELTGPESSGRTSLALSFLAEITSEPRVCAWVDASDTFDAESAAASGLILRQLLWVRCKPRNVASRNTTIPNRMNAHPTSFHPNAIAPSLQTSLQTLDQALRATDLLLQAGGFSALVLDLASTPPEHGYRIPLATWFRFRQAADRTRCSLLVLAPRPFAQSSAALVLECSSVSAHTAGITVLNGFSYQVLTGRERFAPDNPLPHSLAHAPARPVASIPKLVPTLVSASKISARKPPLSTWSANASWANVAKKESA